MCCYILATVKLTPFLKWVGAILHSDSLCVRASNLLALNNGSLAFVLPIMLYSFPNMTCILFISHHRTQTRIDNDHILLCNKSSFFINSQQTNTLIKVMCNILFIRYLAATLCYILISTRFSCNTSRVTFSIVTLIHEWLRNLSKNWLLVYYWFEYVMIPCCKNLSSATCNVAV